MKKTILLLASLSFAPLFANATTVGFSPIPSARTVVDHNLLTLSTTSLVWVGTFSGEAFSFNSSLSIATNVSAITLAGGWEQFTIDTTANTLNLNATSTLSISATGKVGNQATDDSTGATKADFFNNKPIYLWVFNGSTVANSTEMGIFRATTGATTPWTFPANTSGAADTITLSTASASAPNISAIGGAGSTNANQLILVAAVPEPSSLALVGAGLMGMLGYRRRVVRLGA